MSFKWYSKQSGSSSMFSMLNSHVKRSGGRALTWCPCFNPGQDTSLSSSRGIHVNEYQQYDRETRGNAEGYSAIVKHPTSSYILYERKTKKSCIEQIYFQLFDFSTAYKIQQSTIAVFCKQLKSAIVDC